MRCALVLNSLLSLMNLWNQHLKAKKKIIFCLRSVFFGPRRSRPCNLQCSQRAPLKIGWLLLHCDQARWARCDFLFCGDVNAESSEYVFELSQGHNRSPTLALTFFLHNGHTLRQACGLQLRETFFTAQSFSRDAVIVLMSSCFGTG